MAARQRKPTAAQIIASRPGGRRPVSIVTGRIMRMKPGQTIDVTPPDGDLVAERRRLTQRFRTAESHTGNSYRMATLNDRLYVVCVSD